MIKLFKNHGGRLGTWRIWSYGSIIYYAYAVVENGAEITNQETIEVNQSGRTLDQQIQLRIDSKISRQLDRGYKRTREEALEKTTNQLGLPLPMLAKQLKQIKNPDFSDAMMQYKLDGHRCLITKQSGELIAYTRQGKLITTIEHITDPLIHVIPEGWTFDGELYSHGQSLQTISSWIKRLQPSTVQLRYVVYDMMADISFKQRYRELYDLFVMNDIDERWPVNLLLTMDYKDSAEAQRVFKMARIAGYEGLIIRAGDLGYEDGKRSSSLIKMKAFLDDEFKVIDINPSKDGWAICHCILSNGKVFRVSAPGDMVAKYEVMKNAKSYIGRSLTVSFAEYTADGIPFQPTAVSWRVDI